MVLPTSNSSSRPMPTPATKPAGQVRPAPWPHRLWSAPAGPWLVALAGCLIGVALGWGLAGGYGAWRLLEPPMVARVGDHVITVEAFREAMRHRGGRYPNAIDRQALLEQLIARHSLVQQAIARGMDLRPSLLRAGENQLIGELRRELLRPKLTAIEIDDIDVEQAYRRRRAEFTEPAQTRLAILRLPLPFDADDRQRKALSDRLSQVKATVGALPPDARGFGTLAIEHSEDQATRYRGGDAGWFRAGKASGKWDARVLAAGFALTDNGQVGDPLMTEEAVYLVCKLDHRPQRIKPLKAVRERIRHLLLTAEQARIEAEFVQQQIAATPIERHASLLPDIEVSDSPTPPNQPGAAEQPPPPLPR